MIPLEKGQKVITRDGTTGKIVSYDDETGKLEIEYDAPFSKLFNHGTYFIHNVGTLDRFYLLDKNLLKHKLSNREIEDLRKELDYLTKQRDVIRKQLFNLNERMVDDWKERQGIKQ